MVRQEQRARNATAQLDHTVQLGGPERADGRCQHRRLRHVGPLASKMASQLEFVEGRSGGRQQPQRRETRLPDTVQEGAADP
eukprot:3722840-Pyramimonas_sp.AAC.1